MVIGVSIHTDNAGLYNNNNTIIILIVIQDFIWAGVLQETYTKNRESQKLSSFCCFARDRQKGHCPNELSDNTFVRWLTFIRPWIQNKKRGNGKHSKSQTEL